VRTFTKILLAFILLAVVVFIAREFMVKRGMDVFRAAGKTTAKSFLFNSPSSMREWDEKILARDKTLYSIQEHKGKGSVKADSKDSASVLFYKLQVPYRKYPFVSWNWIVGKFPDRKKAEVLNKKKEFDFAAQVYVVFHSRFFLNSKAIQYVWAEQLPVGTVSRSPYTKNVKLMVLESGLSEDWKHEERNIADDYKKLFNEDLEKHIDVVAFMTDSDSTGSSALAYYSDVTIGFLGIKTKETTGYDGEQIWYLRWLSKVSSWGTNKRSGHQIPE